MSFMLQGEKEEIVASMLLGLRSGDLGHGEILQDFIEEYQPMNLEPGKTYLIRTLTFYYTGRVKSSTPLVTWLDDAAWIPDTGDFSQALKSGNFSVIEPFIDPVMVNSMHIVDATLWNHPLPRERKS